MATVGSDSDDAAIADVSGPVAAAGSGNPTPRPAAGGAGVPGADDVTIPSPPSSLCDGTNDEGDTSANPTSLADSADDSMPSLQDEQHKEGSMLVDGSGRGGECLSAAA